MNKKRLLFLIPLVVMIIIFIFSSQNGKTSLGVSDGLSYQIIKLFCDIFKLENMNIDLLVKAFRTFVRKGAHFSVYALLGCSLFVSFKCNFRLRIVRIFAASQFISSVYAITDELHQMFVSGRNGNFYDVCIDSLGAFSGIVIIFLIFKYRSNKQA